LTQQTFPVRYWLRVMSQFILALGLLTSSAPYAPATGGDAATRPASPPLISAGPPQPIPTVVPASPTAISEAPLADTQPATAADTTERVADRTADSATFDLGDGRTMVVQDSHPMHYQDADGAWQRIDPAFTAVANGWVNTTNAINTGLSPRSSKANLTINQSGVGWEPRALEVVNAAGQVTSLATPLPDADALTGTLSADARTVTYAGSWSDTALQDRWESAYGQAAYSLKIAKALTGFGSRSGFVDLRVTLHLFPGTQLQLNGRPLDPAELPLETRDELAFVNAQGETLWLQPPSAYEEGNPAARVEGSYTLAAGADASTVELAARIPCEWLAAADRQYPVVLDPVFQVRTGTVVRRARYHNDGSFWGNDNVTTPELGQFLDGVARIMVKFALPMMPPNTVINNAYLVLAPTDINYTTRNYMTVGAAAYALSNDTWISSGSTPPQYDATALSVIGDSTLSYSRGDLESFDSVTWDVTTLAQAWAPTALNPGGTNYGVIVRQTTEFCSDWSRPDCGGFYVADQFTKDDLRDVEAFYTGETGEYTPPPRGGIRLVVIYSGPTLNEGQLITGIAGGLSNPLSNDPYFHVDHEYRLQALPSHWQAAVARGLGGTFGPNPPTNYNDLYGQNLGGSVLLDLYDTTDTAQTMDPPQAGGLSYILLNGRDAAGQEYRLRVPPNTTSAPSSGYDIRLVGEKADLSVPINSSTVITYYWNGDGFDTHNPLTLWNINLPSGSHARVDIDILDHNHQDNGRNPVPGTYDYARGFAGQLYLSGPAYRGASGVFRPVKSNVNPTDTAIPEGSVRLTSGTFTAGYVPYALALTYLGPQMTIYTCLGGGEFCSPQVANLTFTYRVRITACSGDTFPTRSGVCQQIKCPTTAFPSAGRIDRMGMQLWSENGWTGGVNNDGPAPLIGDMGAVAPTVVVVGGKITYDASAFTIDADSEVMLVNCGTLDVPTNPIGNNYFSVYANTAMESQEMYEESWIEPTTAQSASTFNPWRTEDVADTSGGAAPHVYPITGLVWNSVNLLRRTGNDLHFTVSYSTDYRGWTALQSTVTQVGTDDPPDVAGTLILDLGETFSMDTTPAGGKDQARTFELVRAGAATITQPDNLGGASKPVQAVLLGMGQKIPSDPAQICISNGNGCVDLRALDDTPADRLAPKRQWQMPDVHISGQPGMVVMSTAGNLQVYSVDHPNRPAGTQDVGGQYSFDTFGAGVTVEMEPCAPGEPAVMVIRGETRMTMPNIGDGSNPDGVIAASFKLCQTKLRSVSFQFHSPVGLPIGSSGLFVTGMTGQVDLSPNYTQIKFTLDFQAAQGGDGGLMKGSGSVMIDTRGYFEFSGAGKILGILNASGKLWVAWTPLDIGFEMSVGYSDWLTGMARAHMWEGQGWQHRYPWLPDNDERHIAAQIAATISIEEGAAFSWWFIDIPPWDVDFGIEVAFGQFCTNSSCTGYEWGVKGKFSIVGYDVGLYYGFDDGFDFILGNDGHVLIDQYGGATAMRAAAAGGVSVQQAALAVNGVATETFNVSADAENLLFALGWQAGAPQVAILDPNGVDAATGATYTVAISETTYNRLIGIKLKQPTPGMWRAVLSDLTGQEHYKFVYLANKGAPGTTTNPGKFLTPSVAGDDATGVYTITWVVPPGASPSATVSLNYTHYYRINEGLPHWEATDKVTDVPIVKNLPFNTGAYVWDTSWLQNGHYSVRAIVDDGVNDIPARPSYPKDSCQTRDELPSARAFDTQRFPGISSFSSFTMPYFTSAGLVVISDTVAPAAPVSLTLKGVDSAILARWNPSPEKDVAGYLVRWGLGGLFGVPFQWHWVDYDEMRVSATAAPTVRLGGLSNDDPGMIYRYAVEVSAIDVNDNVGPTSTRVSAQPTGDAMSQVPSAPVGPTLGTITSSCTIYRHCTSTAALSWSPGAGPTPASYRLVYTRLSPSVAVAYTETTGTALTLGLTTGATYSVTVSAANSEGWRSGNSAGVQFVVTNGVDGDSDGLPDDWETANTSFFHPTILPGGDEDNDGVTNLQEYQAQTSPWQQDGDGDGFSDQEEQQAGTDPLDSRSFPAQVTQPRLELPDHRVVIRTKKGGNEQPSWMLFYYNVGGGTLQLALSADDAWITPMLGHLNPPFSGDFVRLNVDTSGLQPGFYSSIVRLNPAAGSQLIGEPQCIRVDTWVSPADDYIPKWYLYLPLVLK